jgi:hypothetical protein
MAREISGGRTSQTVEKSSDHGFQLFEVLSLLLDTLDIPPELSGLEDILHLSQPAKRSSTEECF